MVAGIHHFLVVHSSSCTCLGLVTYNHSNGSLAAMVLFAGFYMGGDDQTARSWLLCVYLIVARVVTESLCRLFPLVVSELVDEDRAMNGRSKSMAASLVGTSALLAKPGESVAPVLGWKFLRIIQLTSSSAIGARGVFFGRAGGVSDGDGLTRDHSSFLFATLLSLPIICVTIQFFCWSRYSLRGSYLHHIKRKVQSIDQQATTQHSQDIRNDSAV